MSEPNEPLSDKWLAKVEKFPCRGDVKPLLAEVRRLRRAVEAARAEQREQIEKIIESYSAKMRDRCRNSPLGPAYHESFAKHLATESILMMIREQAAAIRSAGSPACGPPPAGGKIGMGSD